MALSYIKYIGYGQICIKKKILYSDRFFFDHNKELVKIFSVDENYEFFCCDRNEIDVTDFIELKNRITDLWPDFIFNAVAYNAVDLCEENLEEYEKAKLLNATFPQELARIADTLRIILIHYSSDYIFDGERPVYKNSFGIAPSCCERGCPGCQYKGAEETIPYFEYQEEDQPKPISKYGQTKLAGELAVEKNCTQYYIIRLSKLFGKPAISEAGKKSFFEVMLEKGRAGEELKVIDGEISKFTYAPDLAMESKAIVEDEISDFGIYHIVNDNAVTWYQGVLALFKLANISTKVIPVKSSDFPRPAKRAESTVLKVTKRKALRNYQEALKDWLENK
jgi:dTDP-4-dehydrorhamnose reductase